MVLEEVLIFLVENFKPSGCKKKKLVQILNPAVFKKNFVILIQSKNLLKFLNPVVERKKLLKNCKPSS